MSMMAILASTPVLVNVRAETNDHEMMTVELRETNETRHLVAYGSERIRDALTSLSGGARIPVETVRAGSHPNAWKAVALHDRQTLPVDQSTRTVD